MGAVDVPLSCALTCSVDCLTIEEIHGLKLRDLIYFIFNVLLSTECFTIHHFTADINKVFIFGTKIIKCSKQNEPPSYSPSHMKNNRHSYDNC